MCISISDFLKVSSYPTFCRYGPFLKSNFSGHVHSMILIQFNSLGPALLNCGPGLNLHFASTAKLAPLIIWYVLTNRPTREVQCFGAILFLRRSASQLQVTLIRLLRLTALSISQHLTAHEGERISPHHHILSLAVAVIWNAESFYQSENPFVA